MSSRRPAIALAALATTLAAIAPAPGRAATLRVPTDQPTITAAFTAASPGDTVYVEAGIHSPSATGESFPLFIPFGDIHVIGEGAGVSILDAEAVHRVIHWDVPGGGTIADLTITGGSAVNGGGVLVRQGEPELRGLQVRENVTTNRGAGIFVRGGASPWIHHNVIWKNADDDTTDLFDPHGIVCADSSAAILENNLIGRTDGNGLLVDERAEPVVRQNLFFENGVPTPQLRGRGICWLGTGVPRISHNLFHANQIAALLWPAGGGDFDPYEANDFDAGDEIFGNLDGDPLFVDADGGNWHLLPGSPAIDAGDPGLSLDPDGSIADVGPFFFDQSSVGVSGEAAPDGGRSRLAVTIGPNPFRDFTRVVVHRADSRERVVTVHDLRGRRVRKLASGSGPAPGPQNLEWDGRDDRGAPVAAGIYWVRVRTLFDSIAVPVVRLR